VIASLIRVWNDGLADDDERARLLRPLLPLLIGTEDRAAVSELRAWRAHDWYLRVYAPAWLDLAGLNHHATALRALPAIVGPETPRVMKSARAAARDASVAALTSCRDAAREIAWNAAGEAASAARDAAMDCALPVQSLAASNAARFAAWNDVWDDAWNAASAASRTAAMDAAWPAARDAGRRAARARRHAEHAARVALRPTVERLQSSAVELVRELCAMRSEVQS
jgi:hypothetical protein